VKKKSKISIFAEELKKDKKEYEDLVNNELIEDFSNDEDDKDDQLNIYGNNSTTLINVDIFKKFEVYFYIKLDNEEKIIIPIESDSLNINKQSVSDLIKNVVKTINNNSFTINYNLTEYLISLKDCENSEDNEHFYINNYELRPCKKKNLMPKYDLPFFSPVSLLSTIVDEKISFISKNPLNIMLINNFKDYNDYNDNTNNNNANIKRNIKKDEKKEKCDDCCIIKCLII
jgi:hypothetical protein